VSYSFSYQDTDFRLRDRKQMEQWLNHCIRTEKKKRGDIHYVFCSEKEILRINKEFLKHNYYTDIITFDYTMKNLLSAEIYVSPQTVSYNAKKLGVSVASEMKRVMVHGILHLCGYTDKTKAQERVMREREDFYLLLWPRFRKG
jgi:probable rRNA maturation factor